MSDDGYSRFEYRRLIAWPQRLRREAYLIEKVLRAGPARRVLDLGSGTGEHSRFLVERGFEVVGVDASEKMIERSLDSPLPPGLRFVHGSITELEDLVEETFGGAICLGNTLPHLRGEDELAAFAGGLRSRLDPGAPLLLQILNYERIVGSGQRHLPLNFRPGDGYETVFLRLMTPGEDGEIFFYPTSLRLRPGHEPPLEIVASREVRLRGWTRPQLESILGAAGFDRFEALGSFDGSPYDPLESPDLILVAS
jgi:SAM-dependent methyltransferase